MVWACLKDEALACTWFEKAARQGFQKAQHMLGVRLCKRNRRLEKDYVRAYAWLLLAN